MHVHAPGPTRRQYLRRVGLAATTIGTIGLATTARADHRAPYEDQPEYVDLVGYGENDTIDQELETHQPHYAGISSLEIQPTGHYAWRATSTEEDTTMYCYWLFYPSQQGITGQDSHEFDREFVFVEVDGAGDVTRVLWDGYHYFADQDRGLTLADDTHPELEIVGPWNFYRRPGPDPWTQTRDLQNMHATYREWVESGWNAHLPTVLEPWRLASRGHMWNDETSSKTTRFVYGSMFTLAKSTGLDPLNTGAEQADDFEV